MVENKSSKKLLCATSQMIVELLKQNSRATISEIATIVGVSRTTVTYHIDRLIECGFITRFTIETDPEVDGNPLCVRAFFDIRLRRNVCGIVYKFISDWQEVVSVWSITGSTDMRILIEAINQAKIEELRDRLARHPEIASLTTIMVLKTWCEKSSAIRESTPEDFVIVRKNEYGKSYTPLA